MKLIIEITRQDYLEFNKFHFTQTKLKRTVIIGIVSLILLQLALNVNQFNLTSTIITTIFFVVAYALLINISLNKTKNIPANSGTILGDKEYEFNDDKILFKTEGSEGKCDWKTVKELKESSTAFYLYMDTNMALLVPKRHFKDANEIAEFKELASRKINAA